MRAELVKNDSQDQRCGPSEGFMNVLHHLVTSPAQPQALAGMQKTHHRPSQRERSRNEKDKSQQSPEGGTEKLGSHQEAGQRGLQFAVLNLGEQFRDLG